MIKSQILEPHCTQCHRAYNDYDSFFEDKDIALQAIVGARMPKNSSPLDSELIILLQSWIDQGAPNSAVQEENNEDGPIADLPSPSRTNTSDETEPNDDETGDDVVVTRLQPTWESINKEILQPKCLRCHGSGSFLELDDKQDFVDNSNWLLNDYVDVENSVLVQRLSSKTIPMPPKRSGIAPLTQEEINIVIKWVEARLP